jgi:hypothetical protein
VVIASWLLATHVPTARAKKTAVLLERVRLPGTRCVRQPLRATTDASRFLHRSRAFSRSSSRVRAGPRAGSSPRRRAVVRATSSMARSNAASFAAAGLFIPLTLRTNWSAAARISSGEDGGSKWWRTRMFRHIAPSCHASTLAPRVSEYRVRP